MPLATKADMSLPSDSPPFTQEELRATLGQFATGVTIVTARDAQGQLVGLTANSFNSVSLSPPLVLWSLGCHSTTLPGFRSATHYAINVLAADQRLVDAVQQVVAAYQEFDRIFQLVEQIAHGVLHDPGQRHHRLVSDGRGFRGIVVCGVFHCTIVP